MHVKRCNAGDAGSRGQRRMPLFVKSDPPPKRPDVRLVVLSEVAAVWSAVSRWQLWCGERQRVGRCRKSHQSGVLWAAAFGKDKAPWRMKTL